MNLPTESPEETVAVFGGSFNPPHIAHLLAAALVRATAPVDRVIVVPTFVHAFGKVLAPFEDRFEMCRLALLGLAGVEVSTIERDLGGESRTLRTLERLKADNPRWRMRLVIGGDILPEANKWFGFERIVALAPPLVLGRRGRNLPTWSGANAGVHLEPPPLLPEVSSTHVRSLIAQGAWEELSFLLPSKVLGYIREKGLYV